MKLRISGQSLRFRLQPEDLISWARQPTLREKFSLGGGAAWTFTLVKGSTKKIEATLHGITVESPAAEIERWLADPAESLRFDGPPEILIEKDAKPQRRG